MKFETYKAECKKCDSMGMIKVDENRSKSCDCVKHIVAIEDAMRNTNPEEKAMMHNETKYLYAKLMGWTEN